MQTTQLYIDAALLDPISGGSSAATNPVNEAAFAQVAVVVLTPNIGTRRCGRLVAKTLGQLEAIIARAKSHHVAIAEAGEDEETGVNSHAKSRNLDQKLARSSWCR